MNRFHSKKRGVALLVALFFMVLLSLMGFAYVQLVPQELNSALHEEKRVQAQMATTAVAKSVSAWLRQAEDTGTITGNLTTSAGLVIDTAANATTTTAQWPLCYRLDAPANSVPMAGFVSSVVTAGGVKDANWDCAVYLYPSADTVAGKTPHCFKLRCKTTATNQASLIAAGRDVYESEFVLQQDTFATFGFFVDKLDPGGYYTATSSDFYSGRFHVNGKMPLGVDNTIFADSFDGQSVFAGRLSFTEDSDDKYHPGSVSDGINYNFGGGKTPYDASGNSIGTMANTTTYDKYSRMTVNGKADIFKTKEIPLPKTDTTTPLGYAKGAFYGRESSIDPWPPTVAPASGASVNVTDGKLGGIYVKGDLRDVKMMAVDSLGNEITARDASGKIVSGNRATVIREESTAAAGKTDKTVITELIDSSLTTVIPANVQLIDRRSVWNSPITNPASATDLGNAVGLTIIKRPVGTSQNPGTKDLYEIIPGHPNGVLYVDGNIGKVAEMDTAQATGTDSINRNYFNPSTTSTGGLSGNNHMGQRTIAVNTAANKYIRLAGDITRSDVALPADNSTAAMKAAAQSATSKRDGVGLVGYDIVIGKENGAAGARPYLLNALTLAGRRNTSNTTEKGCVVYEGWTSYASRPMFSLGAYVVGKDVYWGNGGTLGMNPSFVYDSRLATSPPPFFPTRKDYALLAYQEVRKK
jgi:Tfp pilus assembly protein PilX